MVTTSTTAVRLSANDSTGAASKLRKQFNKLIEKLDAERKRLSEWHDSMPVIAAKAGRELNPLRDKEWEQKKALALLLDQQHGHKALTSKQREKLSEIIGTLLTQLLAEREDEELRELCERGEDQDVEGGQAGDGGFDREQLAQMMSDLFGVELDPELRASGTEDEMRRAFEEKMAQLHPEENFFGDEEASRKAKKSGKTSVREQRHEAEAAKLQQSVRDIFRKLTSALHPDRERDPDERARKTALMQRVNVAYGANDLLALLELQLEVDQIDAASLDRLDDTRIKQYNKVLQAQLNELKAEVAMFEASLVRDLDLPIWTRPTPASIEKLLRQDIAQLKAALETIARDMIDFKDIKKLKTWLNGYRFAPPPSMFDEPFWD